MWEIMSKENLTINNMREGNVSKKRGSHHGVIHENVEVERWWKLNNGIIKRDMWRKGWINKGDWIKGWSNPF